MDLWFLSEHQIIIEWAQFLTLPKIVKKSGKVYLGTYISLWPFLEIFVPKPLKCIFHKFLYLTSQISSLYIGALCLKQNCTCFLYWISNLILLSWTKSCFFNFGWNFTIERRYKIHSEGQWQLYAATNSAFLYQSMCK